MFFAYQVYVNYKVTYGAVLCSSIYSKYWGWSTLSGTVLQNFPIPVHTKGSELLKPETNCHKAKEQLF